MREFMVSTDILKHLEDLKAKVNGHFVQTDCDPLLYLGGLFAGVPLNNYLALYLFSNYIIDTSLPNSINKVLISTKALLLIIGTVLARL
jgi:trehalose-6-phosphate synthase